MGKMPQLEKIIIVGAGPAGLSTALRLSQLTDSKIVIYELRDKPGASLGGAIGIPSNGLRLLNRLGLYQEVVALSTPTHSVVLHSSTYGVLGERDLVEWSEKRTGFGFIRIKRADLMEILLRAVKAAGITIRYRKRLERIDQRDDQVSIHFYDGTNDSCDLLLGCDGIHSVVRTRYVDPDSAPLYSGISSIGSIVPTSDLPATVRELNTIHAPFTEDGVMVLMPASASRDSVYWFFSREIPIPTTPGDTLDGWEEIRKSHINDMVDVLINLLGQDGSGWSSLVKDVLRKTEVKKFYPNYKLAAGRGWSKGRVLLLGDAAHAMPPHSSQGFSMALEDGFLLTSLLSNDSSDIYSMIKWYESIRRARIEKMLKKAESRSNMRRQLPRWRHRFRELILMGALKAYNLAGVDKLGLGQRDLIYDIGDES